MAAQHDALIHSKIVENLRDRPQREFVSLQELGSDMGVLDLPARSELVASLRGNPRIAFDSAGRVRYTAQYELRDADDLLALLRMHESGLREPDLLDAYTGVAADIERLSVEGRLIRVKPISTAYDTVLFSRTAPMLMSCPGPVKAKQGAWHVSTPSDLTGELFRGDVVLLDGVPYRVSYTKGTPAKQVPAPMAIQPRFTGGHYTAAHQQTHRFQLKGGMVDWALPFTEAKLPLDRPYEGPSSDTVAVQKYGASKSLRCLWRETVTNDQALFPDSFPKSHKALRDKLKAAGLERVSKMEPGTLHKKTFIAGPKQVRQRRKARSGGEAGGGMSEAHLEGTAAGEAIARARTEIALAEMKERASAAAEENAQRAAEYRAKRARMAEAEAARQG